MPWRTPFHPLRHRVVRPRIKQPRQYFHTSHWPRMPKVFLAIAIRRLGVEEHLNMGPARARFRSKRLRAVEVFRRRFGAAAWLSDYSSRKLPWTGIGR